MKDIIDCARLAPSADNIQPWGFVVVTDKQKLGRISEIATWGSFIRNAAACIIVCGKDSGHLAEDGCAATENILLAAKAHDIGSCWVAGWKKDYCNDLKELLNIPKEFEVVSIVSLGYPAEEVKPHEKRDLDEVLHWETF